MLQEDRDRIYCLPILRRCALGLVRHSTQADTEIEGCENKSQISESLWKDMIVGNKENEKKEKCLVATT